MGLLDCKVDLAGLLPAVLIVAGAFGTFMLYVLLGLLALPATAALDRSVGKEKGLFIYAMAVLAFTIFFYGPEKVKAAGRGPGSIKEAGLQPRPLDVVGDPFARPSVGLDRAIPGDEGRRNIFRRSTDTRDLPPPTLENPPWHPLPWTMPAPIPGPAPAARHVLRGPMPAIDPEKSGGIALIPDAPLTGHTVGPSEVYDRLTSPASTAYIYLLAIDPGSGWVRETERGFADLAWAAATTPEDARPNWQIRFAVVGSAKAAEGQLEPAAVLKAKRGNLTERPLGRSETLGLRETIDNRLRGFIERAGLKWATWTSARDIVALRRVAEQMAEVGRSGQDGGEGWRRTAALLEVALLETERAGDTARRSEILVELLAAYRAVHDEAAIARTLAAYVRANPNRGDGWAWSGDLMLSQMGLPEEATAYYRRAIAADARSNAARLGLVRALTALGRHEEALAELQAAGKDEEAEFLRATTLLRLGRLELAQSTVDALLVRSPGSPEAVHLRGCVLYSRGDLAGARSAFEQAAVSPQGAAIRAQACYGLGLAAVRLGEAAAATAAFEAAERALTRGSQIAPIPDETVSPAFGRAFLAWAQANDDVMKDQLGIARVEAPRSSQVAMFAGMVAGAADDAAAARGHLERARSLDGSYGELDGWLGRVHLLLGESAVRTGAEASEVMESLDRAIAFLERAADRESARDKNLFGMRLREALARAGAVHVVKRVRFVDMKNCVEKILKVQALSEQPAALALRGYANFQLGTYDESAYDECIRDFQQVLDNVPDDDPNHPWASWQTWAAARLTDVKRWRDLEEKRVVFEGVVLGRDWETTISNGPHVKIEDGVVSFKGEATKDGRLEQPTVHAGTKTLFDRRTFERVSLRLAIPGQVDGRYRNSNTFGVQIGTPIGGRGRGGAAGIGLFNDKGRVAVRVGGGRNDAYRDGEVHRVLDGAGQEVFWPAGVADIRIERVDAEAGTFALFLNEEEIFRDDLGGLKRTSRGDMPLWIGGYATQSQPFDVELRDLVVIRLKEGR